MSILIAIVVWILLGLLGTYIGHKFIDDSKFDTTTGEVMYLSMTGAVIFLAAIVILSTKMIKSAKLKEILSRPLFKAKKEK